MTDLVAFYNFKFYMYEIITVVTHASTCCFPAETGGGAQVPL